jgi:gluconate kinase
MIQLDADAATLRSRLVTRRGHYMPATLLESQLATLEPLATDEHGMSLDAGRPAELVIADALSAVHHPSR